jgi:hypothetical protein
MKTKKYAAGGISNMSPGISPLEPFTGGGMSVMGSSDDSAAGGLGQVNAGSKTIGNAISSASKALTGNVGASLGGALGGGPLGGVRPGSTGRNPFSGMTPMNDTTMSDTFKKGGAVKPKAKKYASGGSVKSSASKRADGCAVKGKTKGTMR